jgi:hypothetical protein
MIRRAAAGLAAVSLVVAGCVDGLSIFGIDLTPVDRVPVTVDVEGAITCDTVLPCQAFIDIGPGDRLTAWELVDPACSAGSMAKGFPKRGTR